MSETEIIFEVSEDEVDGGVHRQRAGIRHPHGGVSPWKNCAAMSKRPLIATSTRPCSVPS